MSLVRMRNTMANKLHLIMLGLALVFAVGWIGLCLGTGGNPMKKDETAGLVAKVNKQKIDRVAFEQRAERDLANLTNTGRAVTPFEESQIRGRVLESMISEVLRNQAAKQEHIRASGREVNAMLAQIIDSRIANVKNQIMMSRGGQKGQQMSDQALDAELRKRGMSLSGLKDEARKTIDVDVIRQEIVMQKLMKKLQQGVDTSDEAVKASYEEARFRQITVDLEGRPAAQVEQRAKEISEKLKKGADFAATATQYSEDNYKYQGGDRGFGVRRAYLEKPLAAAVFALKPGQISEPIKLPQSYMIVKLESKKSVLPPGYDDPKKRQAYRQAYVQEQQFTTQNQFFNDLEKNAKTVIYDPEMKAYMATKEMAMSMANPPQALAKAQEAIKELEKANAESGGQSQIAGRLYSQLAYIYQALRTPGVFQLAKEERLKYRALQKKSLDSALEYTESNDLRIMLTDLAMDDHQYGKAFEHLDMVATNVLADDAVMHRELLSRLKKLKAFEPAKVAPMLKTEQTWQAEYDAKQKAEAKAEGQSTATTKPFRVGPR